MKNIVWEDYEKKLLKNKEFRRIAEQLEPEYQKTRKLIAARIKRENKTFEI